MSQNELDRSGAEKRPQDDVGHPGEAEPEMIAYRAAGQAATQEMESTDGEDLQDEMPTRSMHE